MLQPLMRMGYMPVQGYIPFKKFFCLFYLPYPQPGVFVNLLLKKNGHNRDFRLKIEDFRFILANRKFITNCLNAEIAE